MLTVGLMAVNEAQLSAVCEVWSRHRDLPSVGLLYRLVRRGGPSHRVRLTLELKGRRLEIWEDGPNEFQTLASALDRLARKLGAISERAAA